MIYSSPTQILVCTKKIFLQLKSLQNSKKIWMAEYINVATGKNVARILETSKIIGGALRLSGSVQSLDPEVQENIKERIFLQRFDGFGFISIRNRCNSYSEIILGLPGDSKTKHFNTVKTVIEAGLITFIYFS